MVAVLKIFDLENNERPKAPTLELRLLEPSITAAELIRRRVEADVRASETADDQPYRGLITPTDSEQTLNGERRRPRRNIDVDKQVKRALDAFGRNGFFMLAGDRQIETLEERIDLAEIDAVSFIKLVPLVGG